MTGAVTLSGAVMTHPRRIEFAQTLLSTTPTGLLRLVADPDPTGPPTALRTAMRAWSEYPSTATHHLVLQDDVVLCRDFFHHARTAIAAAPDAAIAFYAHWNSRNAAAVRLGALTGARWVRATGEYTPTIALALPVEIASGFAGYARRHGDTWPDDVVMSRYLGFLGVPTYLSVPNLVDHANLPSVMRNDYHGPRQAAC
ncbi:MAG TPA: hypothetical protein VGJ44_05440, partial [Kribbellaceae bacterium]